MTEPKPSYSQVTQAARIAAYPEERKLREGKMSDKERIAELESRLAQAIEALKELLEVGGQFWDWRFSEGEISAATKKADVAIARATQKITPPRHDALYDEAMAILDSE